MHDAAHEKRSAPNTNTTIKAKTSWKRMIYMQRFAWEKRYHHPQVAWALQQSFPTWACFENCLIQDLEQHKISNHNCQHFPTDEIPCTNILCPCQSAPMQEISVTFTSCLLLSNGHVGYLSRGHHDLVQYQDLERNKMDKQPHPVSVKQVSRWLGLCAEDDENTYQSFDCAITEKRVLKSQ